MKTKTKQTTRTGTEIRERNITWRDFSGEGEGRNGGGRYREEEAELIGIKEMGEIKNGIGNRGLKECIYNP